jgi:hypothetical protein
MCKVKNHLFKPAAVFGLPAPMQTGICFFKNEFLRQAELLVARAASSTVLSTGRVREPLQPAGFVDWKPMQRRHQLSLTDQIAGRVNETIE